MAPTQQGKTNESAVIYFNQASLSSTQRLKDSLIARLGHDAPENQPSPPGLARLRSGVAYGEITVRNSADTSSYGSFFADRSRILQNVFTNVRETIIKSGAAPTEAIWRDELRAELLRNGFSADEPALLRAT